MSPERVSVPSEGSVFGRVVEGFIAQYGEAPALLVRAPGRVNLIGEHTDYNDGFVLPMAIDRAVWVALRPAAGTGVEVFSLDYGQGQRFDAHRPERGNRGWIEYVKGVTWAMGEAGWPLAGWQGVIGGDVPLGAGLSSSAALELAVARAAAAVAGATWDPRAAAVLCQRAENAWVGVQCGLMDQMISALGEAGHAVLIDCRTLVSEPVPLPDDVLVVILDTATRRELTGSAYNERRQQCEAAAAHFGVAALRDLTPGEYEAGVAGVDPEVARRGRHVVHENARTVEAARVMRQGDSERLGQLMDDSHRSLRDDFEVSSEALDTMVSIAREQRGCLGARMTGAGFGGCAVALVQRGAAEEFARSVATLYRDRTRLEPKVYVTGATAGASLED